MSECWFAWQDVDTASRMDFEADDEHRCVLHGDHGEHICACGARHVGLVLGRNLRHCGYGWNYNANGGFAPEGHHYCVLSEEHADEEAVHLCACGEEVTEGWD